jgi:uncharacterized protein YaeQ
MKLTAEEKHALECVQGVVSVHSEKMMALLQRLAARGLCEISGPMCWQKLDSKTCPIGIAVITPDGRRALAQPSNNAHKAELEAAHAIA